MGSSPRNLLVFGVVLSALVGLSVQKRHRGYNERCVPYDSSSSCDSNQGLICLDSGLKGYRCLCPSNKLHSQVYDHKRQICVGKVFNACVLNGKASSGNLNESLCVENAVCERMFDIPVCQCKAGFVEYENLCIPALKYGEACNDSSEDERMSTPTTSESKGRNGGGNDGGKCDEKNGLTCLGGKCQCRYNSEQYFDPKEGKCISYANGRCTNGEGHLYSCVPNAKCNAAPYRGSASHTATIGFLPPLPPFLGGLVQAAAAASSSSSSPSSSSVAVAASSSSRDGDDTDDEDTTIFMMPLRPRLPPPPPPPPHRPPFHHHRNHHHQAFLSREDPLMEYDTRFDNFDFRRSIFFGDSGENKGKDDDDQPRCQCLPGYTRTSDGFCKPGYRSKCNPEDAQGKNCNADQFLECVEARGNDGSFSFQCNCRNQMNERYNGSHCVAMIGRRCSPTGPRCENSSECVDGRCQCLNGTSFHPMKDSCMKNQGEPCKSGGECNAFLGLRCGRSKTCECVDSYLKYDIREGACVASRGDVCGVMTNSRSDIFVGCEAGLECKSREMDGRKLPSRCI